MSNNFLFYIIIFISSISTIILVLEAAGFLPLWLSKYLIRRRFANTIEIFKELGCDIEKKSLVDKNIDDIANKTIKEKLKKITIEKEVVIGKSTNGNIFPEYIDLMGATTNERNAKDFARELNTYMQTITPELQFDFIVTSKLGSPILGYEFANLIKKPFALHSEEEKFRVNKRDVKAKFDFANLNKNINKKALIVDDSTTGGRKVIDIINDLREFGFKVEDCLVVFAPQGKDADKKLSRLNVKLHTIVKTPIKK